MRKQEHHYNKNFIRDDPMRFMYYKAADTFHIYASEKGYYKLVDSGIKHLKYVVDENFIVYADQVNDSADNIKVHSWGKNGVRIIGIDKVGNDILFPNNGKTKINDRHFGIYRAEKNGIFLIRSSSGTFAYNKNGKLIFKSKYQIHTFGGKLFAEWDGVEGYMGIIDLKGNYLVKGAIKAGFASSTIEEQCVYYLDPDSCYIFFNQKGKSKKLCRKEPIVHFSKNFIVFKTSDTTLEVYDNDYNLIKQQLLVDSHNSRIDSYAFDDNFLSFSYQNKLYLINVSGKVTPVNYKYRSVIPVSTNYFLGLYQDSLFNKITIVFNSDGKTLYRLTEHNSDFTDENFLVNFSSRRQYFGDQIVLPIVPDKVRMDDYYTPIHQAGIISILKDTVYTISLGDTLCWISINYDDQGPSASQFNIITRCNTDPEVYKPRLLLHRQIRHRVLRRITPNFHPSLSVCQNKFVLL